MRAQRFQFSLLAVAGLVLLTACPAEKPVETAAPPVAAAAIKAPAFNADSAYAYTAKQVAFGPRVPNSKAHVACGNYLVAKLKQFGLSVREQPFEANTFDGTRIKGRNIIAQYQPQTARRVAIFAHWDTRPFADADKGTKKNKPMDGASDGASAVATALEIARSISQQPAGQAPNVGVDIILFDAEDWGHDETSQADVPNKLPAGTDSWCLGSQYWAKNLVPAGYKAEYGILLDMVGAKGGHFTREALSLRNARPVVDKVWNTAAKIGYSDYFLFNDTSEILDDHKYANDAGVPTIDIYDHPAYGGEYFPAYHHTTADNMSLIDRKTLKAVGQTVLQVLYQE
ncbi:M28 family peptidase [Hymenobacter sp. H14-R3]|uniref:M28 family peptidase n=1 Tax=Hymenobacter sp. H14-R3 TaxID=3046308 RepID=UPI0024B9155E|nr:M28 family peptidase [Hymenobacter sp. H14-R3]MDJ0365670.1 M28 family peptidase [Hymenobacter sp. H14-R3]